MRRCIQSRFCRTLLIGTVVLLLLLFRGVPTFGQSMDFQRQINVKIDNLPKLIAERWSAERTTPGASIEHTIRLVLDPHQQVALYALLLSSGYAPKAVDSFKTDVDEARVDKQVGSSSSSAGSTSLTSKGSVPAILGFAVENGSLDKSVSGTTITFTGRPVQIIQSFQKTSFGDSYKQIEANPSLGVLNRVSFALSFDTSRGNSAGTFTANSNQFAAFTLHIDIINYRDPRNQRFDGQWNALQEGVAQQLALSLYDVYDQVISIPAFQAKFQKWLDDIVETLAKTVRENDNQALTAAIEQGFQSFPKPSDIPGADNLLSNFASATDAMIAARNDILAYVGKAPIVTFDYSDNRAAPVSAPQTKLPDTSSFTLIAELAPFKGGAFTLNANASIFNSKPQRVVANMLRDLKASAQLDIPINTSVSKIGNVVLSFSGQYERIPQNAIPVTMTSGGTVTTPYAVLRGDMLIGQAKLTIPVKGSGVKIPISFSIANRTELIKEQDIRGNIGITFDLDSIIGKLKP